MQEFRSAAAKHRGRLIAVFILTAAFLVIEIVGGLVTNSLALLADAGHMGTDLIGIGLALFAIWLATRPATTERTFGWYRVEILAAVINGMILFGVAAYVLFEAWRRFQDPPEVESGLMLLVALSGMIANTVLLILLHGAQAESLNM